MRYSAIDSSSLSVTNCRYAGPSSKDACESLRCSTRFIPVGALPSGMSLEETVDYLAEELDLERSDHVREVGQSVAELRD